jgi:hypothetical protein
VFPGFVIDSINDDLRMEIEIGKITTSSAVYTVNVLRPKVPGNLPFLVGSIEQNGKVIWDYKSEHTTDYGRLAMSGEELVVAFIARGRNGKVLRVLPVARIGKSPVPVNKLVALKLGAATFLDREVELSEAEEKIRKLLQARAQKDAVEAEAKAHAAREDARKKRLQEYYNRERIVVFTKDGAPRQGLPMLENEWPSLPHGTYVVLVDSITKESVGAPIEAFKVLKERGGNPCKEGAVMVYAKKPKILAPAQDLVKPTKSVHIEVDGDFYEVLLYKTMGEIRQARSEGLNGGKYVAVETAGEISVLSVFKDKVDTIGNFTPIVL